MENQQQNCGRIKYRPLLALLNALEFKVSLELQWRTREVEFMYVYISFGSAEKCKTAELRRDNCRK